MKFQIKHDRLFVDGKPVRRVFTQRKHDGKIGDNPDIVVHYTVGENFEAMVGALSKPGAGGGSAHFVLGMGGELAQVETTRTRLWHAGKSRWKGRRSLNYSSVGIEVCNIGWLNKTDGNGNWWRKDTRKYNEETDNLIIGKHPNPEVRLPVCAWPQFTEKQLDNLDGIIRALHAAYDIRDVVGHDDISPGRKQDPGLCFNRDAWFSLWNSMDDGPEPDDEIDSPKIDEPNPMGYAYTKRGSKGPRVKRIQEKLLERGYDPGPIDGDFGPKTETAVKMFKCEQVLKVRGDIGQDTWSVLFGDS